ncbi:MAG: PQQ-dependent sugar dehydrogenase [Cellvibrionaceae bacterium]|nr:PQQ-dependent sugar dehydrogenase [Cellvibrionaceae bacterium]
MKYPGHFSSMGSILATFLLALPPVLQAQEPDGKQLYEQNCAACHGLQFQGSGLGPALSPSSYVYGGQEWDVFRIAKNGLASKGMPAFGDTLNEAQLNAIAKYVPTRKAAEEPQTETAAPEVPQFDPVPGKVSTLDYEVDVQVVSDKLDTPWAVAFPDAQTVLVTERVGRLRVIKNGKLNEKPIAGTPEVFVHSHQWNQGGLLDIALHPEHAKNGWIYLAYSHPVPGPTADVVLAMTRVVRGKIKNHKWTQQEVVYEAAAEHYNDHFWHYGGRLIFDKQGYLYISIGDRGVLEQAREPGKPFGKFHRLHPDGSIPADNPFRNKPEFLPSIYSLGHRNPQGLAIHPETGRLWATEHGPRGGDELNVLKPTGDYGWPNVTYGINYEGTLLTPHTRLEGVEQPVIYWRPSIGVSGMTFYQGREFPLWQNKILVTALARRELRLLTLDGERVQHEETLVKFAGRPYEPVVAPDGSIYVVTDSPGMLLRLNASAERKL